MNYLGVDLLIEDVYLSHVFFATICSNWLMTKCQRYDEGNYLAFLLRSSCSGADHFPTSIIIP